MGMLLFQDKGCVLICWALTLMYCAAEQQSFIQSRNLTWDEARNHCQVCFTELVTVTPDNIQTIVTHRLTSEHWIGLRKNFNATSNSSMPWSHWANGDSLIFQNWYPGWPVLKSPFPKTDCCSCSCTCPAKTSPATTRITGFTDFTTQNGTSFSKPVNVTKNRQYTDSVTDITDPSMTNFTRLWESINGNVTTSLPIEVTCVRSPVLLPDVPETDKNYIEDSCVAMLSFGPWVEKSCLERLPFICYEDDFFSEPNVTNLTPGSATLSWLLVPGTISHYHVAVKGDKELRVNKTDLTHDLVNLTAGTLYSVQVFPVKCERHLNPQHTTFYTIPNKVINLTATDVSETSVYLSWKQPAGNLDFYLVKVEGREMETDTEGRKVDGLIPGGCYTFTILSGVQSQNKSEWSAESNITVYTKPGKASNLRDSNHTNASVSLTWEAPAGNFTGFRVTAMNSKDVLFKEVVSHTPWNVQVTGLEMGSRITLVVIALANHIQGDSATLSIYTAPGPISNLNVVTSYNSLNATWTPPVGNYSSFTVKLLLDGNIETTVRELNEARKAFGGLKTAANYTVVVHVMSGQFKSSPVMRSNFTLPAPPTDAKPTSVDKNAITFEWTAPDDIGTATYFVKLSSSFWGQTFSATVPNNTRYTFSNLTSGTRYHFEVYTKAGERTSDSEKSTAYTDTEAVEVSLSMLCSSVESLLCDKANSRESVFNRLVTYFKSVLNEDILWKLEKQETKDGRA